MQNVHSLQPIPNQTRTKPWQLQFFSTYTQCVPAVLGPQEAVQLVTQRAQEALNDQRETTRRALSINNENFSPPLIKMKRLRGQLLSVLWQDIARRTMCDVNTQPRPGHPVTSSLSHFIARQLRAVCGSDYFTG